MLIITADDYGKTRNATDRILECLLKKRITSISAMVFMEDSERSASLALETGAEVGFHLNFTLPYSGENIPEKLRDEQKAVFSYLTKHKIFQVIYNPLLANSFKFLFLSQQEEFIRLYGRKPEHYNGHHHMHLCTNVLAGGIIPKGTKMRGTFTFERSEKNPLNLLYRRLLKVYISRRFLSTDSFFNIGALKNVKSLRSIINRAVQENIEIGVHPEKPEEGEFIVGHEFGQLLDSVRLGRFSDLVGAGLKKIKQENGE
jgi:predicted glycoside hydrolase/deacetylase ChbG (UPF0249 family)